MFNAYIHFFLKFLDQSWTEINRGSFACQLQKPLFQIDESKSRLGFWDSQTRTIGISGRLLLSHSEAEILDVLKHEMAHQYADEVLGAAQNPGETPHGSAFRHAAARLGIQHHARYAAKEQANPQLRRIQKLLALTQSENPHEAQAAMMKAQELMARFETDLGSGFQDFFYQFLGKSIPRKSLQHQLISTILVRYFHVAAIWIPSSTLLNPKTVWLLEISGTASQLEVADYVHAFLHRELKELWRKHQGKNPLAKGQRFKRDFQVGVLKGLIEKLATQQTESSTVGGSLIHLKKERLNQFLQERHPDMVSGRKMTYRRSDAFHAGLEKGKQLEINKGLKSSKSDNHRLTSG